MKNYMALYIGSDQKAGSLVDNDSLNRGMAAWGAWMAKYEASIVDAGGPLGTTKKASADGLADTKNKVTGYVIVQAESHDAAVRMFEDHPHFAIFPGDSVEVMECLPIPGA